MKKPVLAISGVVLCWCAASLTQAHHSNAHYDQAVLVDVEGVISNKFWRNPHVMFNVTTDRGEEWIIEGASVSNQQRRGIDSDVINEGDRVTVAGYVSTLRENDMLMQHILLASGQELMLSANSEPRWPELSQIEVTSTGPSDEAIEQAKAEAEGLFRVWSWGRLEPGWWFFAGPDAFPFTQSALDKFATWDEHTDNPQLECIAPGMPLTMGNPYPIQFVQHDENTIVMYAHEFDVTRVIHLDAELVATVDETNMGYSVGRWEDENTLVVDTININYPYFNRVGISSGPDLTVHERFVVNEEEGKLHYFTTITDPWALTEPYTKEMLWVWQPGIEVGTYGCEVADVYAQ